MQIHCVHCICFLSTSCGIHYVFPLSVLGWPCYFCGSCKAKVRTAPRFQANSETVLSNIFRDITQPSLRERAVMSQFVRKEMKIAQDLAMILDLELVRYMSDALYYSIKLSINADSNMPSVFSAAGCVQFLALDGCFLPLLDPPVWYTLWSLVTLINNYNLHGDCRCLL